MGESVSTACDPCSNICRIMPNSHLPSCWIMVGSLGGDSNDVNNRTVISGVQDPASVSKNGKLKKQCLFRRARLTLAILEDASEWCQLYLNDSFT